MPVYYEYELEDGITLLVEGPETRSTLRSGRDEQQIVKTNKSFSEALQGAKLQAKMLLKEIEEMQVDEADIKFGLSTLGELGFIAVGKIGIGINYEVTLKWRKTAKA